MSFDSVVSFDAGELAHGELRIGDEIIEYVTITPAGFVMGDAAPVVLTFPPGGQSPELTRSVAEATFLGAAVEQGWVVFSPARPSGGELYYDGAETLVEAMLNWVASWVKPERGAFHFVGASNGGLSAFAAAAILPDRVSSILVFPGYARGDVVQAGLPELADVPVRMFVGETDEPWRTPMEETRSALERLGADVTLEIMSGEGHVIRSLGDGVRIFDELEAAR